MTTQQADKAYIAATYARFPVTLVGGKGAELFDADGKRYVDMGSGIGVNIFGTADEQWTDVVSAQLKKLAHASNLYYTEPCARLAEKLCLKSGMKKVFFANSGAEANECAIKTARKWAAENKGAEYYNIITLKDGFHGRTLATLAATAQDSLHKDFLPLTAGFVYSAANDLEALEKAATENKCAAIMFETVQGEGGVLPLSPEFVRGAAETAAKHNLLLIVDEVQTGVGRTGRFYSFMHFGISPDIVTSAKGLGGGLPIGAVLFGEKTADVLTAGSHGSTFGGNPLAMRAATTVLQIIEDEQLVSNAEKMGQYLQEGFRKALKGVPGFVEVRGRGLMIGIALDRPAHQCLAIGLKHRVLFSVTAGNVIRIVPALNIARREADELIKRVTAVVKEFTAATTK